MDTKQRILLEALRLFSKRGYDAISVEQIASAVGIKAPSLYKHYKSKKDIFDAIFEDTAKRYEEFIQTISIPVTDSKQDVVVFENITAEDLVQKVKSLIEYSLHDEYISKFRKMMTIEQFRSPELSKLYSDRYVNQIQNYHTDLFTKMIEAGVLKKEDPCILAMVYDAPILVMLSECDRHPEKEEECIKKLEDHVRLFYRTYSCSKTHKTQS
ncbi:MAG: TetR/AcrR family transcriptional regulator [Floccifex porci]|uniref:TetR/AcrR family transcriptional regulator n=1 Tax=Floccifex porci TaxID=2606629 RepID=UPI0023F1AB6F|nr:TetR/AcrR family transcriptional regulator [Floccifex porci]MDD7466408.1 TetR/AcrR family transcriptional regulator [Floccifex porci]